jgi:ATP-dependent helicase HrpA
MRIAFDEALPVVQLKDEIGRAILENQVVVVCGETGSGKTTQLPKICLEIGRGVNGLIGHTQPRRVAARSIAGRIAKELQSEIGQYVGYKVRFTDRTGERISIKLMTDGILLAETRTDPLLSRYDTLIIDEAHERSLNIDFILGYLKTILPRRPDLKVIVTSATIDAGRFAGHFDAKVLNVPGRSYPVEVRYRPFEEEEDPDMEASILAAVDEAERHPGDILVFLPGEREIRNTMEALRKHVRMDILPLYSRLSVPEQEKVFQRSGSRRIVLATNVAETSLTVPNIGSVIDTGLARINRYSYRNKVEQLRIESISKASANQRSGRSGRVMQGLCIRLYSEADIASRPEYTDPEILRSSLASAILKMKSMGIGEIESFPFIDPPSPKMVSDGYQLLMELGAVDERRNITEIGSKLSKLPCDPRIGRMILASKGALSEVLVIASVLGIQDPRESPSEKREAAQLAHQAFSDEKSDFIGLLKLWGHFDEMKKTLSNRKLAAECRRQFLSLPRLKEWLDLHGQLSVQIAEMGMRMNEKPASYEEIHQALLSGLLGNIGFKTEDGYLGARGIRFNIFPGSKVKKKPKWLMAAEITETSRLYARSIAEIDPAWVEKAGAHLLKRHYFDPHWEKKSAQVAAFEQVTLYGLIVVPKRRVNFGAIDPELSREIFIRGALVEGEFDTKAPFFEHNRMLIAEVEELEHKARRSDFLVDEQVLYEFYSERIPEGIVGGISFEKWRREAERSNPRLLFLEKEDLMRKSAEDVTVNRYPDSMEAEGHALALSYRFEPGHVMDGVTVTIPLHLLNQMKSTSFDRLVPGLLREKLTHIIKSLPKALRKQLIPVSEHVDKCMDEKGPLLESMKRALKIDIDSFPELPPHLMMNYRIVDGQGDEIAMGRNLEELKKKLGNAAEQDFEKTVSFEKKQLTGWDFDELANRIDSNGVTSYPALMDEGSHVSMVALDTLEKAVEQSKMGVNRLFRLALKAQFAQLEKGVPESLCLRYSSLCSPVQLKEQLSRLAASTFLDLPRTKAAFDAAVSGAKPQLHGRYAETAKLLEEIMALYRKIKSKLDGGSNPAHSDMKDQLDHLVYPGFLDSADHSRLRHYPRYLKAMLARFEKLPNPRDAQLQAEISQRWQRYLKNPRPELEEYRWMIEELRVSLFAQELRTPFPVSAKRLDKLWESFR